MRIVRLVAFALALSALAVAPASAQQVQEKGGEEETGPYDVVPDWPKPLASHDAEWGCGPVAGVFAESPDRVFVVTRGDQPRKGPANSAAAVNRISTPSTRRPAARSGGAPLPTK